MTNADANKPNERTFLSLATVIEIEEQTVVRALHSSWMAPLDPEAGMFGAEIAKRCGVDHTLALFSGTADLHLTLLALSIGEGDYTPVSIMAFAAMASAIAYVGVMPMFADATEDGNIDPKLLLRTVDELLAEGKSVPDMMIVDLFDRCAGYPAFAPYLEELGIAPIEDAAEALSASVDGQPAGSFGRAATLFSNGNKITITSSGGMLLSNDADLVACMHYLSTQARQLAVWHEHIEIGYNYRLPSLPAVLGCAQHSRLNDMIVHRRQIRDAYIDLLASLNDDAPGRGTRLLFDSDERFTEDYWLTSTVLLQEAVDKGVLSLDGVIAVLGEASIEARHPWKLMYLQPVHEGARVSISGAAENLFSRDTTLPSDSALDDDDVTWVIGILKEVPGR